jgi:L,D-transpeptidase catalytic domain
VSKTRFSVLMAIVLTLASIAASPAAKAQDPPSLTLNASDTEVRYGDTVKLTGKLDPAAGGEPVEITDEAGNIVASSVTDGDGRYSESLKLSRTLTLTARTVSAMSEPLKVRVSAIVTAHLSRVLPFGYAVARGSVVPGHDGDRVVVKLVSSGKPVKVRKVRLNGTHFKTRFYVPRPGTFAVRASFADEHHSFGSDTSASRATSTPSLSIGDDGLYVRLLEQRLADLNYHIAGIGGSFDYRTSDALRAFNKVQGRARLGTADSSTWNALGSPIVPKPRATKPAVHWEVDQTRQVALYVKDGKVVRIIHVSTGAGGATHDGVYAVHRKLAGYSGNRLYYPSYFDGLRAFHGWPEVPTYAASHGCVRLPMWIATWVYDRAPIGIEVRVYH